MKLPQEGISVLVEASCDKDLHSKPAQSRNAATSAREPNRQKSCPEKIPEQQLCLHLELRVSPTVLFFLVIAVCSPVCAASAASLSLHVEGRGQAVQGHDYTLACVVTPAPASDTAPVYTWYKNSQVLRSQTGRVLAFTPVSKADEGDFQCGLKLGKVYTSVAFSLRVFVFENLSLESEVEVEAGQTAVLHCSVHSDPTAVLTWRVEGELVLSVRNNSHALLLHNASRLHRHVVQCQAQNEALVFAFLTAYSLIRIKGTYEIINRPWLGPRGTPVLHRPFGLECLVMELPNQGVNVHLTYTWYKDHRVIEGQSDMVLDFPRLGREDAGLYTCTARNGQPRTTSLESNVFQIAVLVPPVVHVEPQTADLTVRQTGDLTVRQTADLTVHQTAGVTLTLTCKVTEAFPGVAPDGYSWSYRPFPQSPLRPLEGRESTLTLGPLTREDRGQYFCQAWNYEDFGGLLPPGNASVTLEVSYLGNISLTPDLKVNKGDNVTLTCRVDCDPPAHLAWIVGGEEVRHVTAKVDHYVITEASSTDSQTYECRASISALPGLERSASTTLTVNCSGPDKEDVEVEFPVHITEQVAAEGSSDSWKIALPIVLVVLALIVAAVLVVCFIKRRGGRREDDANNNAPEKQPMKDPAQVA